MEIQHKRSMRQQCALKHGIFKEFLAEFLGTFVLVVSRNFNFSAKLSNIAKKITFVHFLQCVCFIMILKLSLSLYVRVFS